MKGLNVAGPGEINGAYFDRYTVLHVASGAGSAYIGLSSWQALAIALAWELAEDPLKRTAPTLAPKLFSGMRSFDSKENALMDVVVFMAAYHIVKYSRKK